jgi:hypothetical protein
MTQLHQALAVEAQVGMPRFTASSTMLPVLGPRRRLLADLAHLLDVGSRSYFFPLINALGDGPPMPRGDFPTSSSK